MTIKNKTALKNIRKIKLLILFISFAFLKNNNAIAEEEKKDYVDIEKWEKDFKMKIIEENIREIKILKDVPISIVLKNLIASEYLCSISNIYLTFLTLKNNFITHLNLKSEDKVQEPTCRDFESSIGAKIDDVKNKIVFIGSLSGPVFISTVLEWCIRHENEIDYIVFLGDFCDHKDDNDILYVITIIFLFMKMLSNRIILIHGDKDYNPYPYGEYTKEEKLAKKFMDIKLTIEKNDGEIYALQEKGWIEMLQTFYRSIPYNAVFTFENGKRVYCAQNTPPFVIKETEKGVYVINNKEYISGVPALIHNEDEKTFEKHNRAFSNRLLINNTGNEKITKERSRFLIPEKFYEDFMVENEIDTCVYCGKENKTVPAADNTKSINMVNSKILSKRSEGSNERKSYESEKDNKASILVVECDKELYITAEDMLQEKKRKNE